MIAYKENKIIEIVNKLKGYQDKNNLINYVPVEITIINNVEIEQLQFDKDGEAILQILIKNSKNFSVIFWAS